MDMQPQGTPQDMNQQPVEPAMQQPIQPKKPKKGLIIGIIIGVIAIAAIIATTVIIITSNKGSDSKSDGDYKSAVKAALTNLFTVNSENGLAKDIDVESLSTNVQSSGFTFDSTTTINTLPTTTGLEGSSIKFALSADKSDNKYAASAEFGGIGIQAYTDLDKISIACPTILDGYVSAKLENLPDNYNSSVLSSVFGVIPSDAVSGYDEFYTLLTSGNTSDLLNGVDPEAYTKAMTSAISTAFGDLGESVEINTSDDSVTLTIDGKKVDYKGYVVSLSTEKVADAFINFVKALLNNKEFKSILESQMNDSAYSSYTFSIDDYIDSIDSQSALIKSSLVSAIGATLECKVFVNDKTVGQISFEKTIDMSGVSAGIEAKLQFLGKEQPTDVVSAVFNIKMNDENIASLTLDTTSSNDDSSCNIKLTSDYTGESIKFELNTSYKNSDHSFSIKASGDTGEDSGAFTLKGSFDDIDAGNSFTLNIEELSVSVDDNEILNIETAFDYSVLQEKISDLSGTEYDVLNMDQTALATMILEVQTKLSSSGLFGAQSEE